MRLSIAILVVLSCVTCVGTGHTTDQEKRVAATAASEDLSGEWVPQSRNYEISPGPFTIDGSTWTGAACTQSMQIVRSTLREDTWWRGNREAKETRKYSDTLVHVLPNPACEGLSEMFIRFLITEGSPCGAFVMKFSSMESMEQNGPRSWGSYSNRSCLLKAK